MQKMQLNNIQVSIIVPVFNAEKQLKICLESLINQTLKNIEIICINDGSTDKSEAILFEYANIDTRIKMMLDLCHTELKFTKAVFDKFLALERLDKGWTDILCLAKDNYALDNFADFDKYIKGRECEYEQFLVYLIYRHFANAFDLYSAAQKAKFAAMSYRLIYFIGAALFHKYGELSFEKQVDIMRMFSAEIEYSDENLYLLIG